MARDRERDRKNDRYDSINIIPLHWLPNFMSAGCFKQKGQPQLSWKKHESICQFEISVFNLLDYVHNFQPLL